MRTGPRKLSTEEALYTAAMRALMRRAYSVFEMRTYLERRSETPALALRVVTRLKQEQFIDDGRYALEFARTHARIRRQGRYRIARELRARGVPDRHIEAAIEQAFTETDETVLVRKVIERRMRAANRPTMFKPAAEEPAANTPGKRRADEKKKGDKAMASLYRTLLRAGFDAQLINRELRAARSGAAMPDLPDAYSDQDEI